MSSDPGIDRLQARARLENVPNMIPWSSESIEAAKAIPGVTDVVATGSSNCCLDFTIPYDDKTVTKGVIRRIAKTFPNMPVTWSPPE
jgi:hypothetical protein